jgi:NAD(P)-dependent dehydrogenase (short-subunit alcohol dehydrogenase family)
MPASQKELNMSQELSTDLQGTVMVVTGAGRGIGKEISTMAALRGARVVLLEINEENLQRTVAQIKALGGDVKGYRIDLGNESEIISVLTEIETEFGRIDCLVNNAITTGAEELLETTSDDWNQMVRIVMTAPFLCIKQLLPGMIARGSGNIINIGTVNARVMCLQHCQSRCARPHAFGGGSIWSLWNTLQHSSARNNRDGCLAGAR